MSSKRKLQPDDDEGGPSKKHTLDSDEEDSDDYEKDDLKDSDIEGEEEGVAGIQDEVKITPFNMRDELEEGHFDTEGHYHWNKDAEIKDNWLDNIDWVKVSTDKNYLDPNKNEDSSDTLDVFNEAQAYAKILEFMEPHETIQKTLQRLGKSRTKLSSAERLRRKKLGIVDEAAERIMKFTELVNEILTRTGNMDIYQESYEQIKAKLNNLPSTSKGAQSAAAASGSFDMYADDFEEKEKERINASSQHDSKQQNVEKSENKLLLWEFKWKQEDEKLHGPFSTEQMLKWTQEKYFKEGVYARKVGEATNFYSSNRIDFDLYL